MPKRPGEREQLSLFRALPGGDMALRDAQDLMAYPPIAAAAVAQIHCAVKKAIPSNMAWRYWSVLGLGDDAGVISLPGARQSSGQLEKGSFQFPYLASELSGIPAVRQRQNVQRPNSSGVFR